MGVGAFEGNVDGVNVGELVGASDGGKLTGASVGVFDGAKLFGAAEGGAVTGASVGDFDGATDGGNVSSSVRAAVGDFEGAGVVGFNVGLFEGSDVVDWFVGIVEGCMEYSEDG